MGGSRGGAFGICCIYEITKWHLLLTLWALWVLGNQNTVWSYSGIRFRCPSIQYRIAGASIVNLKVDVIGNKRRILLNSENTKVG